MSDSKGLDLDPVRTRELATTLAKAESEVTAVFAGETENTALTFPGTKIPDAATTALGKIAQAAQSLVIEYAALSTATSKAVTEFQSKDTQNAGNIAAAQSALS
ncbi:MULTISPECIES: hypothetical protein [Nocardia]|uniref:Uncharacterized protein n=1 Tax=Nocardia coubleae TaxID=356147 RepID=A0A846WCU5_9NOCA|nr:MULTISPECIES: hypothetical protein [Nocardia]MCA2210558.1 hypothetical protein [Nocardia rosealba]NKX90955.1 hypothetical protein [Nocardia coubleae]